MKFNIKAFFNLLSKIIFSEPAASVPDKQHKQKLQTKEQYKKTIPAMRINPYVEALKSSISAKIGLPYIYGGDLTEVDFQRYGLDCSGFVLRCFQDVGMLEEKYDTDCTGLYQRLIKMSTNSTKVKPLIKYSDRYSDFGVPLVYSLKSKLDLSFNDNFERNANIMRMLKKQLGSYAFLHSVFLIFYGSIGDRLGHVTFWYNHALIAEAGGGGQACKTKEEAESLKDAKVRFSPYIHRADEIADIIQIDCRSDYLKQ